MKVKTKKTTVRNFKTLTEITNRAKYCKQIYKKRENIYFEKSSMAVM